MARPPLALGTHGSISAKKRLSGNSYVAYTRFRDFDGVTRLVERAGRTKTAAIAALQDEVRRWRRLAGRAAPAVPHASSVRQRCGSRSSTPRWAKASAPRRQPTPTSSGCGRSCCRQWGSGSCRSARSRTSTCSSAAWLRPKGPSPARRFARSSADPAARCAARDAAQTPRHLHSISSTRALARALTPEERKRSLGWMQGKSADPKEAKAQEAARRPDRTLQRDGFTRSVGVLVQPAMSTRSSSRAAARTTLSVAARSPSAKPHVDDVPPFRIRILTRRARDCRREAASNRGAQRKVLADGLGCVAESLGDVGGVRSGRSVILVAVLLVLR